MKTLLFQYNRYPDPGRFVRRCGYALSPSALAYGPLRERPRHIHGDQTPYRFATGCGSSGSRGTRRNQTAQWHPQRVRSHQRVQPLGPNQRRSRARFARVDGGSESVGHVAHPHRQAVLTPAAEAIGRVWKKAEADGSMPGEADLAIAAGMARQSQWRLDESCRPGDRA